MQCLTRSAVAGAGRYATTATRNHATAGMTTTTLQRSAVIAASASVAVPAAAVAAVRSSRSTRRATPGLASFSLRTGPSTPHHSVKPASFALPAYSCREVGERDTLDWRLFVTLEGRDVSPWHNIPLLAPGSSAAQLLFSYINEIPKGSRPKMEIATKEAGNPIRQDTRKGALRSFTYGDVPFNYGCLPQTWENPLEVHPLVKRKGDNDPLDVVELSDTPLGVGSVRAVKVLGALALLDEEETDWKVLAIDADHPLASQISNAADIETHFPGKIDTVREWFRNYKTTDGKDVNQFAFDEQVMDVGLTHAVIWECHGAWASLCRSELKPNGLAIPAEVVDAAKA